MDVLPGMNAGASTSAVPSPIEGSGTAWVLLGSWALSPARPTPIHPRPERRGFSALLVSWKARGISSGRAGGSVSMPSRPGYGRTIRTVFAPCASAVAMGR